MAINGTLRTVQFPDLLEWLKRGTKTGCLTVTQERNNKHVYFRNGDIIFATSVRDEDRFGEYLIRNQVITPEQLNEALELQRNTGKLLGESLVDMKLITDEELGEKLRHFVEGIIFDIFTWKEGNFEFIDSKMPPIQTKFQNIRIEDIIAEGIKKVDEWEEITKVIPSLETVLQIPQTDHVSASNITLSPEEFQLLAKCDGHRVVSEICEQSVLSEFETCQLLAGMVQTGFLEIRGTQDEDANDLNKRAQLLDIINLYQIPHQKIIEKMELDGGQTMRFKLDEISKTVVKKYPQFFSGSEEFEDGSLDAANLVTNLFYLPADERKFVLKEALGELLMAELNFAKNELGLWNRKSLVKSIKNELKELFAQFPDLLDQDADIKEHLEGLIN